MKKTLLGLLLVMALLMPVSFGLSGMEAYADDGDYIKINNVDDLYNVRNDLSANYKLMCDIDLTEVIDEGGKYNTGGIGWEPFGASSRSEYTGVFDGNGHVISGLSMNNAVNNHTGLFWANSGTIKNLAVKGTISITNTDGSAINSFIAGVNQGSIINCSADGTISGNSSATSGMICGENSGTVSRCRSDGTLKFHAENTGKWGGICGLANSNAMLSECYSNTYLDAVTSYRVKGSSAGIAGQTDESVTIENCYNSGKIEGEHYEAYYSYDSYYCIPNGIAGGTATIKNCYNTGKIVWGYYYFERNKVNLID